MKKNITVVFGGLLFTLIFAMQGVAASVELKPYGFIRFETIRDNTELFKGDWQLFAYDGDSPQADRTVLTMTGRHTRFGIKLNDPNQIGTWKLSGLIEVDFAGGFPNSSTAARQPLLRLRHALVILENDDWEVRLGQDWVLLSAPFPRTANFVVGAGMGNLWMRTPQIRVTTRNRPVNVAVSLNRALDGNTKYDGYASADLDPIGDGERTGIPWVMARAWTGPKHLTLSVFGHYGTESIPDVSGDEHDVPSWSVNGSVEMKSGKFSATTKAYYGENLNSFFGGILQGVVARTNSVETVSAFGGWGTLGYAFTDTWAGTVGVGIDNPTSDYFTAASREQNTWLFANAIYTPLSNLQFMFETDYLQTEYGSPTPAGENIRVMFLTVYTF